jgi:hypothetical protein
MPVIFQLQIEVMKVEEISPVHLYVLHHLATLVCFDRTGHLLVRMMDSFRYYFSWRISTDLQQEVCSARQSTHY